MKNIKQYIASLALVIGFGAIALSPVASAVNLFGPCNGNTDSAVCSDTSSITGVIATVINTLLFVIIFVAIIVIIVAAIRMVTSAGKAETVTNAKNSILYAVIGIIVALSAYAITSFVVTKFK